MAEERLTSRALGPADNSELRFIRQPLSGGGDVRLSMRRRPDSPAAAAYRVLRHRLAHKGGPRLVAVTSAQAREGKSICAANLALALAEGEERVLLMEANLHHPDLSAMFQIQPAE